MCNYPMLKPLPQKVVMSEAVLFGGAVYASPLWSNECVGLVWGHKQI